MVYLFIYKTVIGFGLCIIVMNYLDLSQCYPRAEVDPIFRSWSMTYHQKSFIQPTTTHAAVDQYNSPKCSSKSNSRILALTPMFAFN